MASAKEKSLSLEIVGERIRETKEEFPIRETIEKLLECLRDGRTLSFKN